MMEIQAKSQVQLLYCSETLLTGEPGFIVSCGCILGTQTAAPLGKKQTVNPLDQ